MSLDKVLSVVTKGYGLQPVQLGSIKAGGLGEERKKKSGEGTWRAPRKDDHWTITTLNRTAAGDLEINEPLMAELLASYGEDSVDAKTKQKRRVLRQIPIRLLSDDIDDVLQAGFSWYGSKACGARSDGSTVKWFHDPKPPYNPLIPPREEQWSDDLLDMRDPKGNKLFKLHAKFSATIASRTSVFGGIYAYRTTSVISFKRLAASLIQIQQLTGGVLVGMPLMLVLRPIAVTPEVDGTRIKSTVYCAHVELRGEDIQELQKLAVKQLDFKLKFREQSMAMTNRYRALLAAPETAEESAAVSAEFAPEWQEGYESEGEEPTETFDAPSNSVADLLKDEAPAREVKPRSTAKANPAKVKTGADVEAEIKKAFEGYTQEILRADTDAELARIMSRVKAEMPREYEVRLLPLAGQRAIELEQSGGDVPPEGSEEPEAGE